MAVIYYDVFKSEGPLGPWTKVNQTPIPNSLHGNSYNVEGLTNATTYYIMVVAGKYDSHGNFVYLSSQPISSKASIGLEISNPNIISAKPIRFSTQSFSAPLGAIVGLGASWWQEVYSADVFYSTRQIAYNNYLWIAVGTNTFLQSTDGFTWTQDTGEAGLPNLSCITYGNGRWVGFVASGGNDIPYVSTDGVTWTAGTAVGETVWRVAYGNGYYVAACSTNGRVAYSTDGLVWTKYVVDASQDWLDIYYGNGNWIVVGEGADIFRGTDITNSASWASVDSTLTLARSVSYSSEQNIWIVVGVDGIRRSLNGGVTWSTPSTNITTAYLSYVSTSGPIFRAIGGEPDEEPGTIWRSTNGDLWAPEEPGMSPFNIVLLTINGQGPHWVAAAGDSNEGGDFTRMVARGGKF